jgi:excisionase family DNA binding protein
MATSTKLSGALLGGKTDTAICSSNHPIGFTGLPAVTRAAHVRGTGGVARLPRCICIMLTVKELSAWLNIKESTLYLWASQNKIPCRRIHGLIRFEAEAIQAWLNSFELQSSAKPFPLPTRHDHP